MKPSALNRPLSMVGVLLLAMLACMSNPAPTTAPTEPPAPVAVQDTAIPPTEAPTEPVAQQYFTEEFEVATGDWSEVVEKNAKEGDTSEAKLSIEDGRLKFDLGKWLIAYKFYDPYEYTNVRIDAHVENRGTNVNNILLVCRASEEGRYLVNIANSGLFAMYAFNASNGTYARLADGGSNKIKSGKEFNDYSLVCKDRDLTLYINGKETRQYTDNQYVFRGGKIAVGVASEDQLPVKVEFDSVKISEP